MWTWLYTTSLPTELSGSPCERDFTQPLYQLSCLAPRVNVTLHNLSTNWAVWLSVWTWLYTTSLPTELSGSLCERDFTQPLYQLSCLALCVNMTLHNHSINWAVWLPVWTWLYTTSLPTELSGSLCERDFTQPLYQLSCLALCVNMTLHNLSTNWAVNVTLHNLSTNWAVWLLVWTWLNRTSLPTELSGSLCERDLTQPLYQLSCLIPRVSVTLHNLFTNWDVWLSVWTWLYTTSLPTELSRSLCERDFTQPLYQLSCLAPRVNVTLHDLSTHWAVWLSVWTWLYTTSLPTELSGSPCEHDFTQPLYQLSCLVLCVNVTLHNLSTHWAVWLSVWTWLNRTSLPTELSGSLCERDLTQPLYQLSCLALCVNVTLHDLSTNWAVWLSVWTWLYTTSLPTELSGSPCERDFTQPLYQLSCLVPRVNVT